MPVAECPWCGRSGNLELRATTDGFYEVQVRCSNWACGATCPNGIFNTKNMTMKEAEKKAIEKWNKRTPSRKRGK